MFLPDVVFGKQGKYFVSGSEMPAGELSRKTTCLIQICTEKCGSKGQKIKPSKAKMLHTTNTTNNHSHNESADIMLI